MKKLAYILVLLLTANFHNAQVAIGKTDITNNFVSLEFGIGNKSIVLPWVTSQLLVLGAVNGTIIFDSLDKKVKYLKNGSWFDLTVDTNGAVDTSLQNGLLDYESAKVDIGTKVDDSPGILVLTDSDKAMILPKMVSPHLNIKNPTAGSMAYDTNKKQLAVYNGTNWTFWKP